MSGESTLRAAAGALAMLGGRSPAAWRIAGAALLLGVAVFGVGPGPLPEPARAAFLGIVIAALLGVLYERLWPAIAPEALLDAGCVGLAMSLAAIVSLRDEPPARVLVGVAAVLAGVSHFGAWASIANAEAGWRRGAFWALALASPGLVGALAMLLAWQAAPGPLAAGTAGVAVAAWIAPFVLEGRRTSRELQEEVSLGLLPQDDVAVLARPWLRRADARFGRPDERREYVRAALLLAVARQQQRRRTGEAIRLRQLEVISFRTRMRRALEVRAERARRLETAEMENEVG